MMIPPKNFEFSKDDTKKSKPLTHNIEKGHFKHRIGSHLKLNHNHPTPELMTYGGIKLGWIQGVLIPCLLNIFGVMLFLRIAWIVAQAGIGITIAIIALASVVCVITTLSLSAICTNGEVQGGGVYYLVSRSLGAELGASVGLIFAFANSVAASMNTIGFCESLNELLRSYGLKIIDNGLDDTRLVGAIALLVMCFICAIGMDWETKTQNLLIVIILVAISNYIIGVGIGPRNTQAKAQGFVGINRETATENWLPDYRYSEGKDHNFISVFAMYFPAVTGVQAGANICGDLKDPASAIPKGTLTALAISVSTYLTMALLCGAGGLRDASGRVAHYLAGTLSDCKPKCEYGLHNNYAIMHLMSLWSPLIYAGCWAATLSTALTNLLSVPRLIQALGIDRIYPGLIFFSKPYGKHGEPYRGYVLVFIVSLMFLYIADLNSIAPLITNFYLASYSLINFCTFHAAIVHHISWRPSFKYFNKWVSLIGFGMCVTIMIIISWYMALATFAIFWTLYFLVMYRKPDVSWGSSTEAQTYYGTVSNILHMNHRAEDARSYNPQLLVLAGKPYSRPTLLDLGHLITKNGAFMIVAEIHSSILSKKECEERRITGDEWLRHHNYRGLFVVVDGTDLSGGTRSLLRLTGLGRLAPNIVLVGYRENWFDNTQEDLLVYYRMIQCAFEEQQAIMIFRLGNYETNAAHVAVEKFRNISSLARTRVLAVMNSSSDITLGDERVSTTAQNTLLNEPKKERHRSRRTHEDPTSQSLQNLRATSPSISMSHFNFSIDPSKTLDCWWLYDDGGLNILLPYIIAHRSFKEKKMPLRIFALARQFYTEEEAEQYIKLLLAKFRISYSTLVILTGIGEAPESLSWEFFQLLVNNFMAKGNEPQEYLITSGQLAEHNVKTSRYLRLRELMLEKSSEAGLIVMSLPNPRKNKVPAALYMAWLEVLSRDLPPILFVRGCKPVLQM